MLLNFPSVQRRGKGESGRLRGRTGHGVARLKEWLFVVGGLDQQGDWVNEIQRIHCQSGRTDSLLLDGGVCLDGACLFSLKETLYLWGGSSLS